VKRLSPSCSNCGSHERETSGVGTEQLEEAIQKLFPGHSVARIDSDTMRSKKALNQVLTDIHAQKHQILVGTQILAKGHHFPNLSLVAILDVDAALFSADFRATEQLAQLITQVSGRTGRAGASGEMWLQTFHPDNSILLDLLHNGYGHFARTTLRERRGANLPPFEYQILIRVEAIKQSDCHQFLMELAKMFHMEQSLNEPALRVIGPFPALMEKRQGRFRMQLLLSHIQRLPLHRALNKHIKTMETLGSRKKVRWSIDVDPIDFH
jgi:primosomal protein N' (replication factor Y)